MQRIEPIIREELGLTSADEDYDHQLINKNLKKEWGIPRANKVNMTFDESHSLGKLRELKPQRKLSHDKEEVKLSKHAHKDTHDDKAKDLGVDASQTAARRRTLHHRHNADDQHFEPLGRSKTITGINKTNMDNHDDISFSDLYKIDLEQINVSISTLFMTTLKFSDELVRDMISGLGELIVNNVEDMSAPTNSHSSKTLDLNLDSSSKGKKNLFSLRKLTEIVLVNIFRIDHFWQIIVDQLMVISV